MSETIATKIALIKKDIFSLFEDVGKCVTKVEFAPVQKIVYGIVGLGLTALAIGLFKLVIKQ